MSPRCFELVVTPPRAQKSPYAALTKNGSFHLFHMTSCKLWCNFCLRSEAHLDAPPSSNIIKTQSTWQWFIYLFIYFLSEMIIFFSDLLLGLLSGKKQQPFNKSTHKPVIILSHNRHSAVSLGQALQSFLSPIFIIQLSLIIAQSVVATSFQGVLMLSHRWHARNYCSCHNNMTWNTHCIELASFNNSQHQLYTFFLS